MLDSRRPIAILLSEVEQGRGLSLGMNIGQSNRDCDSNDLQSRTDNRLCWLELGDSRVAFQAESRDRHTILRFVAGKPEKRYGALKWAIVHRRAAGEEGEWLETAGA